VIKNTNYARGRPKGMPVGEGKETKALRSKTCPKRFQLGLGEEREDKPEGVAFPRTGKKEGGRELIGTKQLKKSDEILKRGLGPLE